MERISQFFDGRAEIYLQSRPNYPEALITKFQQICNIHTPCLVADIGSGTGKLSELFLHYGYQVIGVEPSADMRRIAEHHLSHYPLFTSINGKAEASSLADHSIALITVGHAYHWFDPEATQIEFRRILQLGGWVMLVWNVRALQTPWMRAYDKWIRSILMKRQDRPKHAHHSRSVADFFNPCPYTMVTYPNQQELTFQELTARVFSSASLPLLENPDSIKIMNELYSLFEQHHVDQRVIMTYTTQAFIGKLHKEAEMKP